MTTEERLARLEAENADLKRRLGEHENMRSGAFDALAGVQTHMERLQQRMTAAVPVHPVIQAAREEGLLPKVAIIMTRQTALETWVQDLTKLVLDLQDPIHEIAAALKAGEQS